MGDAIKNSEALLETVGKSICKTIGCIICWNDMAHLVEDLFRCDGCGLISSDIPPDLAIYDRSYEIKYKRYEPTVTGQNIQGLRYNIVRRHLPLGEGAYIAFKYNLLDFGCGVGSFLKWAKSDLYIDMKGFDPNPHIEFCDVAVLFDHYDVVTFWDSLEHLKNPDRIIRGLNPEYLFICTPSIDDWHRGLRGLISWRHYMPLEHCHYFCEESLTKLLELCNYEILEVNYDESKERRGGGDKNILTIAAKRRGRIGLD